LKAGFFGTGIGWFIGMPMADRNNDKMKGWGKDVRIHYESGTG
jgi:hypothetical protein